MYVSYVTYIIYPCTYVIHAYRAGFRGGGGGGAPPEVSVVGRGGFSLHREMFRRVRRVGR